MTTPRMTMRWPLPLNLVPAPGRPGQAVPQRFSANVFLPDAEVSLTFEVDGDEADVVKLAVEGRVRQGDLRLAEWTARALDAAAAWVRDRVRSSPAAVLEPVTDEEVGDGRLWNGLTDDHLKEVAEIFNTAETTPIVAVAEHFRISHSTARGRVTTARKRGLLV